MATNKWADLLGADADNLLNYSAKGFNKSQLQLPGGDIVANLAAYQGITLIDGDGTAPIEAAQRIAQALTHVRAGLGPALLRLRTGLRRSVQH